MSKCAGGGNHLQLSAQIQLNPIQAMTYLPLEDHVGRWRERVRRRRVRHGRCVRRRHQRVCQRLLSTSPLASTLRLSARGDVQLSQDAAQGAATSVRQRILSTSSLAPTQRLGLMSYARLSKALRRALPLACLPPLNQPLPFPACAWAPQECAAESACLDADEQFAAPCPVSEAGCDKRQKQRVSAAGRHEKYCTLDRSGEYPLLDVTKHTALCILQRWLTNHISLVQQEQQRPCCSCQRNTCMEERFSSTHSRTSSSWANTAAEWSLWTALAARYPGSCPPLAGRQGRTPPLSSTCAPPSAQTQKHSRLAASKTDHTSSAE